MQFRCDVSRLSVPHRLADNDSNYLRWGDRFDGNVMAPMLNIAKVMPGKRAPCKRMTAGLGMKHAISNNHAKIKHKSRKPANPGGQRALFNPAEIP